MAYREIFAFWIDCWVVSSWFLPITSSKYHIFQYGGHSVAILDLKPFWKYWTFFSAWHYPAIDSAYQNTPICQILQMYYENSHPKSILIFFKYFPCLICALLRMGPISNICCDFVIDTFRTLLLLIHKLQMLSYILVMYIIC